MYFATKTLSHKDGNRYKKLSVTSCLGDLVAKVFKYLAIGADYTRIYYQNGISSPATSSSGGAALLPAADEEPEPSPSSFHATSELK